MRAFAAGNSPWGSIEAAPPDPILGLAEAFKKDTDPNRQMLGIGAYRDNDGKPVVLECVKRAEAKILADGMDHEYSGIDGIPSYRQKCIEVAYGADHEAVKSNRIVAAQSLSGTGSLRVSLDFAKEWYKNKDATVYVPDPTWPTHMGIATRAGFPWKQYRYYDRETKGFNLTGMLEDLDGAPNESIIMLHVCAHNPTGQDPTPAEWKQILEVVKRKSHLCLFDSAYQGFASGDLDRDAYSLRLFADHTDRIMLSQSFAKNFGLYGERVGCVSVVCSDEAEQKKVTSRVKGIARPMYSNPPIHGARVADIVLSDPELTAMWHNDLKVMSKRMAEMRTGIVDKLAEHGSKHDWSHITN